MLVVDTNILAYLLVDGPKNESARSLWEQDDEWVSEPFILIEFSNLIATATRKGDLESPTGLELLATAESLMEGRLVPVSHRDAFGFAVKYGVSAYDARYLVLAAHYEKRLVTEDRKLREAAPDLTTSLEEALRAL